MTERLTVHANNQPIYDIVMKQSFEALPAELDNLHLQHRKLCIVTDSTVASLYLKQVEEILLDCCSILTVFVFPAGEESKNLDTVRDLYEHLIKNHFDRKDLLVALGGGVTGDLCGYAAATYLRGINFVQIPTTLLSQVDSSIGGKTGVDFHAYKNMVGAFHMPKLVYTNVSTLLTLPDQQFTAGLGEIIKHGLICDQEYYQWLGIHRQEILNCDLSICASMILRSDEIKRNVVEEDPTEQGKRALLNFGHTLGHAIEKNMNFQMIHGHCVGVGSLAAAFLSARRGLISMNEVEKLKQLMLDFHMPVSVKNLKTADIIAATKNDKKMDGGVIRFILLQNIGTAFIDCSVTETEMADALSYIID